MLHIVLDPNTKVWSWLARISFVWIIPAKPCTTYHIMILRKVKLVLTHFDICPLSYVLAFTPLTPSYIERKWEAGISSQGEELPLL